MKQKVLVIVGPTSSGKSALAVELARRFNGEVISADSRQVYKGLDIGTGKITKREMQGVRHHLLDIVSPQRVFTAHDFVERARAAVDDIAARGKLPIVAGGTGFYIDSLLGTIALPPVEVNKKLRTQLEKRSVQQLYAMLKKRDPRRAEAIDKQNPRRLIRALEIVEALGKVPPKNRLSSPYNVLTIGMTLLSKVIERKIQRRLKARLKSGMVAEARRLRKEGLSMKRMRALGLEYRALADHLDGTLTRAQLEESLSRDIRRYAKRQLTYWKRDPEIAWVSPAEKRRIRTLVANWLKR